MANEDYYEEDEANMKGRRFATLNSSELYGSSISKTQASKSVPREHKPSPRLPILINTFIPGLIALQFFRNR